MKGVVLWRVGEIRVEARGLGEDDTADLELTIRLRGRFWIESFSVAGPSTPEKGLGGIS